MIRLSGQVSTLTRQQKYFRTRENRNFSTVRSTEKRIFNFSLLESGLMVAMAGLQVFVVKMFFTGGRKGWLKDGVVGGRRCDANGIQAMYERRLHFRRRLYSIKLEERLLHIKNFLRSRVHNLPRVSCHRDQAAHPTLSPSSITIYSSPTIIFISSSTMKFS